MPESLENATLDEVLDHVGPGKLIRSDVFTWMLERIRDLEGGGPPMGNRLIVPRLFGRTLSQARQIINQPTVPFTLGQVLNVVGEVVSPSNPDLQTRTVVMQMPGAGLGVPEGRSIDLVIGVPVSPPDDGGDGGGSPVTGFIQARFVSSPNGQNLPVGSTESFPHTFRVENRSDSELTIQLNASATSGVGDWTNAVVVRDESGSPTSAVTLDAGTEQEVTVVISVPSSIARGDIGEDVILRLDLATGAPANLTAAASVTLEISEDPGDAVTQSIEIINVQIPAEVGNLPAGEETAFSMDLQYTTSGPRSEDQFTFTFELSNPVNSIVEEWDSRITAAVNDAMEVASNVWELPVDIDSSRTERVTCEIFPPPRTAEPQRVDVTFRIEGTVDGETLSDEFGPVTATAPAQS